MRIIRQIFISLGIVIVALCAGAMLLSHWSAFGWKALAIPTGSMRPTMPPGSLVLVHRVPDSALKIGDVITYTNPLARGHTVTHRIIKKYKIGNKVPAFVTKGDANPSADRPIVGGLVLGEVTWHVQYLGELLLWSKTWLGIIVLIYLPALFITAEEIQRLNRYFKQSQPYKLYKQTKKLTERARRRWAIGLSSMALALVGLGVIGPSAAALLSSNSVSLTNNRISVMSGLSQCSGSTTNNTQVNVNVNNSQSATSGNANSTGSGSAQSGNTGNSSSTNTSISVTNC